ncbi:hypothetical protein [Bradyrhizobium sp. sBnM-33]|uniref:hypothetical protein n=1 Tax=Bradyrhizobium sp. sBnM-33 TaxID=2831780 RepID=UPI001BCC02AA|nr:hypothetical protein [Bradyrhizobium sp. sBnM-33]WOH53908.1 hypothetical protein RX328_18550 [Bradyrhizobium sp. sBnM-33]
MKNNSYPYGIRDEGRRATALMAEQRYDPPKIHTHSFPLADLPTALRYPRARLRCDQCGCDQSARGGDRECGSRMTRTAITVRPS